MDIISILLIEPMWNWNDSVCLRSSAQLTTFNRTNVELKQRNGSDNLPRRGQLLIEPMWNWNRRCQIGYRKTHRLLIEPMWNWNVNGHGERNIKGGLLIEPMWNWNSTKVITWWYIVSLLIEPMWNWNSILRFIINIILFPFNRTNVELKHAKPSLIYISIESF